MVTTKSRRRSKDPFVKQAKAEIRRRRKENRRFSVIRMSLDIGVNPAAVSQLLCGSRPHYGLREKLARYLGIPYNGEEHG